MRNVLMIRTEPGLVSIPVEKAVYCKNCKTISTSAQKRCGLCGSEQIIVLAPLFTEPIDPDPACAAGLAAEVIYAEPESRGSLVLRASQE